MNCLLIPLFALQRNEGEARDDPGDERNPQVDKHALGDLPDGDVHHRTLQAEPAGQHRDEHIRKHREEQDLEDGIERHQGRAVLRVAPRQLVPDDDHGDAAGQPDHDQADHVLGVVPQKRDRQDEHQDGADHPVLHQGKEKDLDVPEDPADLLVLHLRERRIHHKDEAGRDGDRGCPHLKGRDPVRAGWEEVSLSDSNEHRQEDPERQIPIEKGQTLHNTVRHVHVSSSD